MTISSETNRSGPFFCNGATTTFPYGFKITDASHVRVVLTDAAGAEADLSLGTHYTVAGVGDDNGGTVTLATAYAAGYSVTALLNVPFLQKTDLENQGAYYAETVEAMLDLAAQRDLQLKEELKRAVKVPASSQDQIVVTAALIADLATVAGAAEQVAVVAANIDMLPGQITAAQTAAATATNQATFAAESAATATNQATAASGSATTASTKAGEASASAGAAAASALSADAARVAAQAARDQAQAIADINALGVPFTPYGDIAATNVQAAIQELDTEKASVEHTHPATDITGLDVAIASKANTTDVNTALAAKADAAAVNTALAGKAATTHVHAYSSLTGLPTLGTAAAQPTTAFMAAGTAQPVPTGGASTWAVGTVALMSLRYDSYAVVADGAAVDGSILCSFAPQRVGEFNAVGMGPVWCVGTWKNISGRALGGGNGSDYNVGSFVRIA